jgi:hypothetical protein
VVASGSHAARREDRAPAGISQLHREAGRVSWPRVKAPEARAKKEHEGEMSIVSPDIKYEMLSYGCSAYSRTLGGHDANQTLDPSSGFLYTTP